MSGIEFYYSAVHPQAFGTRVFEASKISKRYMISTEECCASDNMFSMDDKIPPHPVGGGRKFTYKLMLNFFLEAFVFMVQE